MASGGAESRRLVSRRWALAIARLSASAFLSACTSHTTDEEHKSVASGQDEETPKEEILDETASSDVTSDIVTPLYSITIPPEISEMARWSYRGMPDNGNAESFGVFAQETNVFFGEGQMTAFFVTATWNAQGDEETLYPQGDFENAIAGEIEHGDRRWYILVSRASKAFLETSGKECPTSDYGIEEIASWVHVGFDPEAVTDDRVFVSFLESSIGDEWSHSDGLDYTKSRLASILESGYWDVTYPGLTEETVRQRDDTSTFDFTSVSFRNGSIEREIPLSMGYAQSVTNSTLPSPALYEVFDWEPHSSDSAYEDPDTDVTESGVKLTLIVSLDDGMNWDKRALLFYEALPYALATADPFLVMTNSSNNCLYTLNDPIIRDAVDHRELYLAEARLLVERALSEQESSFDLSGFGYLAEATTSSDQVEWALPAKFENNKFDETSGHYVKLRYPSSSLPAGSEDSEQDFFCTAYVYDYGNGTVYFTWTTSIYTMSSLF